MTLTDKSLWIVCGTLEAGGAERIISVLSAFFSDHFENVKIITWRDAPVFYKFDKRITIVSIPKESGKEKLVSRMMWFRKYVGQHRPDVVLSFLAPFNMLTLISLWHWKGTVLVADRNDPLFDCPNRVWRKIRDMLYRRADRLSVQTLNNKNYFSAYIRKKTDIIYNPLFIPEEMIGRALNVPKKKTIVSVGRLNRQKNQELLLEAFARVYAFYPDYQLIIYGEGELRGLLEEKIRSLDLVGKVILPGLVSDIHQRIPEAELFVMSSDYEGMSNALIEAMCLGLPCISTNVSGAEDLIRNTENGVLVSVGDCETLANAMLDLLRDKQKARRLAREGIKLASRLEIGVIIDQWLEFIEKGIARS